MNRQQTWIVKPQKQFKNFLNLNKEGQTIVMVTHEMEYANLTDRIVTLLDGKVVSDKIIKAKK